MRTRKLASEISWPLDNQYELFSEYFEDDHRSNHVWNLGHFAAKNGTPSRLERAPLGQEIGRDLKNIFSKTNDGTTPLKLIAFNLSQSKEFIRCTHMYNTRVFTQQAGSWRAMFFDAVRKILGSRNCGRKAVNLVVPYFSTVIQQIVHMLQ